MSRIKETYTNSEGKTGSIEPQNMICYTFEHLNRFVIVEVTGQQCHANIYVDPQGFVYDGRQMFSANTHDHYQLNKYFLEIGLNAEQIKEAFSRVGTMTLWSFRTGQTQGANHERGVCKSGHLLSQCDMQTRSELGSGKMFQDTLLHVRIGDRDFDYKDGLVKYFDQWRVLNADVEGNRFVDFYGKPVYANMDKSVIEEFVLA